MDTSQRFYRSEEINRGSVYTPYNLARAMSSWAIRSESDSVLDPSSGDGVFLDAATERLLSLNPNCAPDITGVDIDGDVTKKTGAIHSDFFAWDSLSKEFSVILGNPPYIRSHIFPKESKQLANDLMKQIGVEPKSMMSSWVPFTAICAHMLQEGGRMAFVLPEELLTVQYSGPLREWLLASIGDVTICPTGANVFTDAQVKPLIVLIEKKRGAGKLRRISWEDFNEGKYSHSIESPALQCLNGKWTHVLMQPEDLLILSEINEELGWPAFSHYGRACVGVVSGNKSFFIRSATDFKDIPNRYLTDIVCNAVDLPGVIFTASDLDELHGNSKRPSKLLTLEQKTNSKRVQKLIEEGESQEVHLGYKCRNREPWFSVPSIYGCDAFMLRQSGEATRLILNRTDMTSNSTIHRVIWNDGVDGDAIVASFMNSFTLLMSEVLGRPYGGGVLTIVPGDANVIPFPPEKLLTSSHIVQLDKLIRNKDTQKAIELVDSCVLLETLGPERLALLQSIRKRVADRRMGHKNQRTDS